MKLLLLSEVSVLSCKIVLDNMTTIIILVIAISLLMSFTWEDFLYYVLLNSIKLK